MSANEDFDTEAYEIVTPPTDLRKKVRVLSPREAAKFDPVKAAEAALECLSSHFDSWMGKEVDDLFSAWSAIQADGMDKAHLQTLYQAAHNIKGQAQTLGYPLVGSVAANFCHLIESIADSQDLPLPLVGQHVEAIRAMVAENARDDANRTGVALLARLKDVTEDYLEKYAARTAPTQS
ncbi:Hpt domain-containing protein [Polymorphum gilvum]|uniref:Hpt domain protein n=1 Tax=Polymorphum gilvum (strain LMG 25793 / CGMCC 1.9160 / SL003B-26A1) TaxID=991905 RepID=F2J538_POLGS|nr:Hpt domain-containing protein [Polymorphum gilvum]ADZ70080.1 Hpt domain protein [Polymorphum gilvum SL003B-26A1]